MRSAPLTVIRGGINRQRLKGGARADALYDLVNGYVTDAGTVRSRPGTRRVATLNSRTRGLVGFAGRLHTFCDQSVNLPSTDFVLHLLVHPDAVDEYPIALEKIHFAAPYLGALYVVAEFEDGAVYHYWLEEPEPWQPGKIYKHNQLVRPVTANGIAYRASRAGDPYPAWAPNVPRTDDEYTPSIVEPTVYNDFYYVCVAALGSNPQSGSTEPSWPTEEGAQVIEEAGAAGNVGTSQAAPTPPSNQQPSPSTTDRYGLGIDGNLYNIP